MNALFAKNSSSKVLALWFIGTALILFAVISPADEAATRTTPVGETAELRALVIPSLYPEKLIDLDLRNHLVKIQVRKAQIGKAVRHLGDIDNYFSQEVYIRWEEKMANQQIEVQVNQLQIGNAALKMNDIESAQLETRHPTWRYASNATFQIPTTLLGATQSIYLYFYYFNVLGLNPFLITLALTIFTVYDGVNDPIIGFLVDRNFRCKNGGLLSKMNREDSLFYEILFPILY